MRHGSFHVLALAMAVIADCVVLNPIWSSPELAGGQYRRGYFEEVAGTAGITLDREGSDVFFPNVGYHLNSGDISAPPGTLLGVPLTIGTLFRVFDHDDGLPPYCVFGRLDPGVSPTQRRNRREADDGTVAMRLGTPLRLTARSGQLDLIPWDPSQPLRVDEGWLGELRDKCRLADGSTPLEAAVTDDTLVVRLGTCELRRPAAVLPGSSEIWMAVIAGGHWNFVARAPETWRVERTSDLPTLGKLMLASVAKNALFVLGPGVLPTVSTSATLAAASLWAPPTAILCWVVFTALGLLVTLVRGVGWLGARPFGKIILAIAAALGVAYARLPRDPPLPPAENHGVNFDTQAIGDDPRCVLTGYSTADDSEVRAGTAGTWRHLAESCAACGGGVVKYAEPGGTLPSIRRFLCAEERVAAPGKQVVFLGGSNDDFFFWANQSNPVLWILARAPGLVRIFYYYRRPTVEQQLRMMNESAAASAALVADQQAEIDRMVRCSTEEGRRFWFLHDFLIVDLIRGRAPVRESLLTARREAVAGAGGHFVSLLDAFGSEAGVAWFNDQFHLSSIGHRHVAELVCGAMESDLRESASPAANEPAEQVKRQD